jgi:hypothetical protein
MKKLEDGNMINVRANKGVTTVIELTANTQ